MGRGKTRALGDLLMGYFGRLLRGITGQDRHRLANQMALLGAPEELVKDARRQSEDEQELLFRRFIEGRHGCVLDWRATRDDVLEELSRLLSERERHLLPSSDGLPTDASAAISQLQKSFAASDRVLVHTESFGDFSFLILVPRKREHEFLKVAAPWLIDGEKA